MVGMLIKLILLLKNLIFTNDLKRKYSFFSKNVHSYRPTLFNDNVAQSI